MGYNILALCYSLREFLQSAEAILKTATEEQKFYFKRTCKLLLSLLACIHVRQLKQLVFFHISTISDKRAQVKIKHKLQAQTL